MLAREVLDKDFHGISIRFSDKWARIVCDDNLFDFLNKEKGNTALQLAEYILSKYEQLAGCKLNILRHFCWQKSPSQKMFMKDLRKRLKT